MSDPPLDAKPQPFKTEKKEPVKLEPLDLEPF
jgi:hypothetical protein